MGEVNVDDPEGEEAKKAAGTCKRGQSSKPVGILLDVDKVCSRWVGTHRFESG